MFLGFTRMVCVPALAVVLLTLSPASASEPQGLIQFDTEGVKTPPEGAVGFGTGEKVVTLVIRSARSLQRAVLVHDSPPAISQRLTKIQPAGEPARAIDAFDGKSPSTIELGPIEAGAPLTLEFAESCPEGAGGVVTFTIEATTADGKVYRESYGQVVGTPGKTPVIHDGLIEFPAHEVPTEDKP